MKETFLNKNIKIINEDCLIAFKQIENESIDIVVTSPPYNVGIGYDKWNDNLSENEYRQFTNSWIKETERIIKKGGRICINIPIMGNNPKMKKSNVYLFHLPQYLEIIRKYFLLRECITWIKSYAEYDENVFCGNNTVWGSWLSPSNPFCRSFSEFIIVAHKETPGLQHKGKTDLTKDEFLKWTKNVWFFPSENDRTHPAPFPEELPKRCIKLYSYVDDMVLDPFSGYFTTGLVCAKLNRKFIGIEISENYCKLGKKRINDELSQLKLL